MKARTLFFAAIIALAALAKAAAATYSFEPVADARIIDLSGDQNVNYAADILSVYTSNTGNTQRTVIQFDVSPITLAIGEKIQSATLSLTVSTAYGANNSHQPMEVYRVLSPWAEASVTWSNRNATHAWATSGGDFAGTNGQPYAVSTNSPADGQTVMWDVTALVQEWVTHASTNNGLLLRSYDGNSLTFRQREVVTPAMRPNLTVVVSGTPLPFHTYSSGGNIVVWWASTNSVLQEKTNLNPAVAWSDSARPVTQSNGSNSVTISAPKGNNFFRLRNGP